MKVFEKKLFCFVFLLLVAFIFFPCQAEAILELSIAGSNPDFGFLNVGEEKELVDNGSYQQEVTCKSTNNRTWNLNIYCLRPLSSQQYSIAAENFTWAVTWTDGKGNLIREHEYAPFSATLSLVYISQGEENNGTTVKIQFRYRLRIPLNQPMGNYYTLVRFNLVEPL